MKLYQKAILLITPLIVIPMMIVSTLTNKQLVTTTEQSFNLQVNLLLEQINDQLENDIQSAEMNIRLLADHKLIKKFALQKKSTRNSLILTANLFIYEISSPA